MARITVEDCLTKETNRFALVLLAAKRTKMLLHGTKTVVVDTKNKAVVTALREIAAGKVRFMSEDEILQAAELRREQVEAAREASQRQQRERAANAVVAASAAVAAEAAAESAPEAPAASSEVTPAVVGAPSEQPEEELAEKNGDDSAHLV